MVNCVIRLLLWTNNGIRNSKYNQFDWGNLSYVKPFSTLNNVKTWLGLHMYNVIPQLYRLYGYLYYMFLLIFNFCKLLLEFKASFDTIVCTLSSSYNSKLTWQFSTECIPYQNQIPISTIWEAYGKIYASSASTIPGEFPHLCCGKDLPLSIRDKCLVSHYLHINPQIHYWLNHDTTVLPMMPS